MLNKTKRDTLQRWLVFGGWLLLTSLLFMRPLVSLMRLSLSSEDYSHLPLIPVFTICLLFVERRAIFTNLAYGPGPSSIFVILGIGLVVGLGQTGKSWPPDIQLAGHILALVLLWIAGFAFSFGRVAIRAASFPLLFLFLTIPLPNFLVQRIVYLLQAGSADITGALFDLLRVPALREGFIFHLPQVSIAVGRECSGIRSSMALLILALPVVHFGMRRLWKKALFLVCAALMMIVKNGIRIATLTLLAIHVDPGFLFGRLHREGGVVFFLLGLLLLLPVYFALQAGESPAQQTDPVAANSVQHKDRSESPEMA
jgi:exosortase